MYSSHEQNYYNSPYWHEVNYPMSYQSENFYSPSNVDRQFGQWFPSPIGPPPSAPPGQGLEVGAPTSPPPSFVPYESPSAFAVDPGSIRGCLFRFTYLWLRNRQQFWFFPTLIGSRSVSGFRWTGARWVYFGISLREIRSFTCV